MRAWPVIAIVLVMAAACGDSTPAPANATPAAPAGPTLVEIARGSERPVPARQSTIATDLDAMIERGSVRILAARSRTQLIANQGVQRGRTVDAAAAFEALLNQRIAPRTIVVDVIETPEDALISGVLSGAGDIAANLLLTFERDDQVAFAKPVHTGIRELVVTGPKQPALVSLEDVGGRTIHVRKTSDHYASLIRLNGQLKNINRPPARIVIAPPSSTDEDLLEQVNSGKIPATIADDYVFDLWRKSFDQITANRDVAVSQDGILAWATRKDAPKLLALLDEFFTTHKLTF